jgi:hypothetical protein
MSQGTTSVVPITPFKWFGLQPLRDVFPNTSRQSLPFSGFCLVVPIGPTDSAGFSL